MVVGKRVVVGVVGVVVGTGTLMVIGVVDKLVLVVVGTVDVVGL